MAAGDTSQTTPIRFLCVALFYTNWAKTTQHENMYNLYCGSLAIFTSNCSAQGANEAISKLTAWDKYKKYSKHKLTQKE